MDMDNDKNKLNELSEEAPINDWVGIIGLCVVASLFLDKEDKNESCINNIFKDCKGLRNNKGDNV